MKIGDWRKRENKNRADTAAIIDVSVETLRRYELPYDHPVYRIPNREQMGLIYLLTNGEVQPNDFYDLPDLTSVKRKPAA